MSKNMYLETITRQGMKALLDEIESLDYNLEETSELAAQLEAASKSLWEECNVIKQRKSAAEDAVRKLATSGFFIHSVVGE